MAQGPLIRAPRAMLERKPPHGAACNRCGLCCVAMLCDLGQHIFRKKYGPCPALARTGDDTFACGVVLETQGARRDAALLLIGAGAGTRCDARFDGEPADETYHRSQPLWDIVHAAEVKSARDLWGM